MKKLIFILLVGLTITTQAQTASSYEDALKLKSESKFQEAFPMFQKLLKSDSSNVNYLHQTSFLYSKLGVSQKTEAEKLKWYKTGEYLAQKAIRLDDKSAGAHYAYALSLGRLNENASSKTKIANSKLIKAEAEKAIALNPKEAGPYHIMGRWHRVIAGFNAMERVMINAFFGGVPIGGTYEDAIKFFNQAIALEPNYALHQYEMAMTYYERDSGNDKVYAKVWCEKALKCPVLNDDDKETVRKCNELIKKL
ncbi:MAG: hypothetical protein IPO27_14735 [Bacteroidetes bacterium]|nr:hypothetical protein [Bacteroidota bacterium]